MSEKKMHPAIRISVEGARGCGYREKPGALYLVARGKMGTCGKLPVSLDALNHCPCCGAELPPDYGIRFSRAPRMLANPELLWRDIPCHQAEPSGSITLDDGTALPITSCRGCPLDQANETGPALLLWIGEQYYKTPADFLEESTRMGISRRIPQVPEGFEVGKTWVLLAHPKAIAEEREIKEGKNGQLLLEPRLETFYKPGVIGLFKPERIEVLVTGDESDEQIDALVKRGLSPVKVIRDQDAAPLPDQPFEDDPDGSDPEPEE